jgi:hypothetical protein
MSMSKICVRMTATATFYADPGVLLDPEKLAEALENGFWEFPADDSLAKGMVVGGNYVMLDWDELHPKTVEVLWQDPTLDDAWQLGVCPLPEPEEMGLPNSADLLMNDSTEP